MDAFERNKFLMRLKTLQSLCSSDDDSLESSSNALPSSLLLICGQDGRFNRGAMLIMKYLFRGAVGKELIESEIVLDASDEILEETVLLITRCSVSIFYSPEMKARIANLTSAIPFLVEYMPTQAESDEIDLFQDRKVTDFKRMILQNVKDGDKVGIPVPIGYDDIMEIEGWPLIQSFALDSVCCSTGFFTARYKVVDISERLETVVRAVDGYHLDNALQLMTKTISPHMDQFLQILDTSSAEQRRHLQAADIIGPLEVLFEFAAMETSSQEVAATMSPILLLGAYTAAFGASNEEIHSQNNWRSQKVGNSLHCILEACEPSIGLRWCRTYFLQRGRAHTLLSEIDSLVDEDTSKVTQLTTTVVSVPADITDNVRRLESVYVKLWFTLRYTVKFAFAIHSDVLEAGTFIQQKMDFVMAGEEDQSVDSESVNYLKGLQLVYESCKGWDLGQVRLLQPLEQLQVHMDCVNALGDIVSIEDVDDMGGACWTYIRVSVHSIPLRYSGKKTECTVAVGDTFLFSPLATVANNQQLLGACKNYIPTMSDSICVTHTLPYYRSFVGAGVEEKTATRILSCARSTHYLSHLGLGRPLDLTGSGLLSLLVLVDHPVCPVADCNVRIFSEGFLIESFGSSRLPVLISIASHVQSVWVVDSAECLAQAIQGFYPNTAIAHKMREDERAPPAGLLIVFKLKTDSDREEEVLRGEGKSLLLPYNPLSPLLSYAEGNAECKYISLFAPTGSRVSSAMITATAAWRVALRMHGVTEHRGAAEVRLPDRVLLSYIAFTDWFADGVVDEVTPPSLLAAAAVAINPVWQYPTMAPICMRAAFSLSEMQRLSHFPFLTYISSKLELKKRTVGQKRKLCAVVGHAGSGVTIVGTSLFDQLSAQVQGMALELDLTDIRLNSTESVNAYINAAIRQLERDCTDKSGDLLVVAIIVLSPLAAQCLNKVIEYICQEVGGSLSGIISVVSAAVFSEILSSSSPNSAGLGQELWRSSCLSVLHPGVCDLAIAVNCANATEDSFAKLRAYVGDVNPSLPILKALPGQLRLDNDFMEQVLSVILPVDRSTRSGRFSDRLSTGYPSDVLLRQLPRTVSLPYHGLYGSSSSLSYPRLTSVRISLTDLRMRWDNSSVLAVLQFLFPAAKSWLNNSNALFGERWHAPPKSNLSNKGAKEIGYFARIRQLAIAKVMAAKQYSAGRHSFRRQLQALERTEPKLAGLCKGIRSVHGWLRADTKGHAFEAVSGSRESLPVLRIEANGGNIILRAHRDEPSAEDGGVVVEGIFDDEEKVVIIKLFRLCEQFKLSRMAPLKPSEITYSERFLIQSCAVGSANSAARDGSDSESGSPCAYFSAEFRQYLRHKALPSGWWFDGQIYVEASGNRSLLRPDIDEVLEIFAQGENRKRELYNQMLMEIQEF